MNITIRQGETLQVGFSADDLSAQTVRLVAVDEGGQVVVDELASFSTVDGKRVASISTENTLLAVGEYEYMITIEYQDGTLEKLPDADLCEGDCELPKLIVCKAIDLEVS